MWQFFKIQISKSGVYLFSGVWEALKRKSRIAKTADAFCQENFEGSKLSQMFVYFSAQSTSCVCVCVLNQFHPRKLAMQ